jgi:4'-phosphopantetheinyl transferase
VPDAAVPEATHISYGVDLWAVDLAGGAGWLVEFSERHDFTTAAGARGAADRERTAARIALRLILAGYVGAEVAGRPFALSPAGKPSLAPGPGGERPDVHFNLAHCESTALVAVSREGPVGVDIEAERHPRISDQRRSRLIDAARAVAPRDDLPDGPPEACFLQAWVRLEALAKATGEGLGALLGRLDEVIAASPATAADGAGIIVRDAPIDGHGLWAAVAGASPALAHGPPPIVTWLPLEDAWLQNWVSRTIGRPPLPPAGLT